MEQLLWLSLRSKFDLISLDENTQAVCDPSLHGFIERASVDSLSVQHEPRTSTSVQIQSPFGPKPLKDTSCIGKGESGQGALSALDHHPPHGFSISAQAQSRSRMRNCAKITAAGVIGCGPFKPRIHEYLPSADNRFPIGAPGSDLIIIFDEAVVFLCTCEKRPLFGVCRLGPQFTNPCGQTDGLQKTIKKIAVDRSNHARFFAKLRRCEAALVGR